MATTLNYPRGSARIWAPPLGEVTTLVAVDRTGATWPAGTRILVGASSDLLAAGHVLGTVIIATNTATWALTEADCATLRAHTRFVLQVPSGASYDGVIAGQIILEGTWSGSHAIQTVGTVAVGPTGPPGTSAYAAAVSAGYEGTDEEWAAGLASERLTAIAAADRAEAAANHAQGLITSAVRASYDPGTDAEVLTLNIPTGMLDPIDPLILLLPVEVS